MGEWKNQRTCHAAAARPATYSHTQEHIHIRKKTYSYTQDHIQSHTHKVIRIRRSTFTYTKMHTIYKKNITFTYGKSPRKHIHLRLPKVPEPPTSFQSIESSRICLYHHLEDCGTSWTVQKLLEQQLLQTLMQSSPLVSSLNCFLLHHLHHWVPFGQCW